MKKNVLWCVLLAVVGAGVGYGAAGAEEAVADPLSRPITINFQNEPVRSICKMVAAFTGTPVAIADDVNGNVTMQVHGVSGLTCLHAVASSVGAVVVSAEKGVRIVKPLAPTPVKTGENEKLVSFRFQDTSVSQVVTAIAHFAKVNLVFAALSGNVSLDVSNMPWKDALKQVLRVQGKYRLVEAGGVYRIEVQ